MKSKEEIENKLWSINAEIKRTDDEFMRSYSDREKWFLQELAKLQGQANIIRWILED